MKGLPPLTDDYDSPRILAGPLPRVHIAGTLYKIEGGRASKVRTVEGLAREATIDRAGRVWWFDNEDATCDSEATLTVK